MPVTKTVFTLKLPHYRIDAHLPLVALFAPLTVFSLKSSDTVTPLATPLNKIITIHQ